MGRENFEFIRHDVTDAIKLEIDQIYHLACPASPVHYKYNPIKTTKTSFIGTLNMLGLAKRTGARFLLTSTSEVYGDPLQHPQTEEYWGNVNPIGERACYDEGKRVAETLAFDYWRSNGVEIRVIRIFNSYGPRMALDDGRVVSNFVAQALLGQSLTVYGDGQQTRSFQYVSDLINGMVKMMDNDKHIGPFNIGNPNEFTMLELANVVKEVVNPNTEIVFMENTSDDPGRRQVTGDRPMCIATFGICLTHRISASKCRYSNNASYRHKCSIYLHSRSTSTNYCVLFVQPDITKATLHLGWEPKIPLKDGLRMMVTDFRTRLVKLGEKVVV